jgi:hypothetical protein
MKRAAPGETLVGIERPTVRERSLPMRMHQAERKAYTSASQNLATKDTTPLAQPGQRMHSTTDLAILESAISALECEARASFMAGARGRSGHADLTSSCAERALAR